MHFDTPQGPLQIDHPTAIVAGWTGRDSAAVEHHIAELAEIGVPRPSAVPLFYRVSGALLTQNMTIEVLGPATSGEVEPLIVETDSGRWLGLASDHTDRELEAVSVAASKQACAKPVAPTLWPWEDVADHLDDLRLRCEISDEPGNDDWTLYQDGTLAAVRPLPDLAAAADLVPGQAMLCGTLAAIGGVRPAAAYRMTLEDPVLGRGITLTYGVTVLPVIA